jgi:hypothetical protein
MYSGFLVVEGTHYDLSRVCSSALAWVICRTSCSLPLAASGYSMNWMTVARFFFTSEENLWVRLIRWLGFRFPPR